MFLALPSPCRHGPGSLCIRTLSSRRAVPRGLSVPLLHCLQRRGGLKLLKGRASYLYPFSMYVKVRYEEIPVLVHVCMLCKKKKPKSFYFICSYVTGRWCSLVSSKQLYPGTWSRWGWNRPQGQARRPLDRKSEGTLSLWSRDQEPLTCGLSFFSGQVRDFHSVTDGLGYHPGN